MRQKSAQAPLQTPRCAHSIQLSHQESEIQCTNMKQQPFEDVWMTTEICPPHPTRFIEMRAGSFQSFSALAKQVLSPVLLGCVDDSDTRRHAR